jgi:hypothetical protein
MVNLEMTYIKDEWILTSTHTYVQPVVACAYVFSVSDNERVGLTCT